jgi:hypothetical protein
LKLLQDASRACRGTIREFVGEKKAEKKKEGEELREGF